MDKKESEARELCAWANWCKDCWDCSHMTIPQEPRLSTPAFPWGECQEWKHYLKNPAIELIGRILCGLRLHKWHTHTVKLVEIRRTCERCAGYQIYMSNVDYTKGKWSKTQY